MLVATSPACAVSAAPFAPHMMAPSWQPPTRRIPGFGAQIGMAPDTMGRALGFVDPASVPTSEMSGFHGAPDTLNLMRDHAWGEFGEHSVLVRMQLEDIVRDVRGKDYLGEILAVRNWVTSHLRYVNDPLHIEYVKTPQRLVEEVGLYGVALADCDEMAQLIATFGLQLGREADYAVVGFGAPGDYSHVFARILEPKSNEWIICDPVAGTDERTMADRVTTYELWSLDEV